MDPVAHTLVGAALAESGLKRRTRLGTATLLIGANLPDVDIAAYVFGEPAALSFRRGWTHGVLAIAVLPVILTGLIMAWDRWRRWRSPDAPAVVPVQVLLLATIAVVTHPVLDFLNVYGVRWLMPFDARWFYGDTLFIVDPWLWAILAGGVMLARRRGRVRPARAALLVGAVYVALMGASTVAARWLVWRSIPFSRAGVTRVMVAPRPVNPLRRYVVIDEGEEYRVGTFAWFRDPRLRYGDMAALSRRGAYAAAAGATRSGRRFMNWARFPFYIAEGGSDAPSVVIIDARYTLEPGGFGSLTVETPPK